MKVRREIYMRLDELIRHIYENMITSRIFPASTREGGEVIVSAHGEVSCRNTTKEHTFPVEVEEALTEDTEIHGATLVYFNELSREVKIFRYADVTPPSLKHIIQSRSETKALAVFVEKQLIWTKEHGIPEDGILEVD